MQIIKPQGFDSLSGSSPGWQLNNERRLSDIIGITTAVIPKDRQTTRAPWISCCYLGQHLKNPIKGGWMCPASFRATLKIRIQPWQQLSGHQVSKVSVFSNNHFPLSTRSWWVLSILQRVLKYWLSDTTVWQGLKPLRWTWPPLPCSKESLNVHIKLCFRLYSKLPLIFHAGPPIILKIAGIHFVLCLRLPSLT